VRQVDANGGVVHVSRVVCVENGVVEDAARQDESVVLFEEEEVDREEVDHGVGVLHAGALVGVDEIEFFLVVALLHQEEIDDVVARKRRFWRF